MEAKKSPEANLENKRFVFIQIGLVVGLAVTLLAFEWKSFDHYTTETYASIDITDAFDEPLPQVVRLQQPTPIKKVNKNLPPTIVETITEAEVDTSPTIAPVTAVNFIEIDDVIDCDDLYVEKFRPIDIASIEHKPSFGDCGDLQDEEAKFICTQKALFSQLNSQIEVPEILSDMGKEKHKTYIKFVVMPDGNLDHFEVMNADRVHPAAVEESLRALKTCNGWNPGKQLNKPVPVSFVIPIAITVK